MKKLILISLVFITGISSVVAQSSAEVFSPITTGAAFLTVGADARQGGMGDTGGATAPDESSQFWNPAKYAFIDGIGGATVS